MMTLIGLHFIALSRCHHLSMCYNKTDIHGSTHNEAATSSAAAQMPHGQKTSVFWGPYLPWDAVSRYEPPRGKRRHISDIRLTQETRHVNCKYQNQFIHKHLQTDSNKITNTIPAPTRSHQTLKPQLLEEHTGFIITSSKENTETVSFRWSRDFEECGHEHGWPGRHLVL